MARLAATSRIAAHRSAIKLDLQCLILCIIKVADFFGQGSTTLAKKKNETATQAKTTGVCMLERARTCAHRRGCLIFFGQGSKMRTNAMRKFHSH